MPETLSMHEQTPTDVVHEVLPPIVPLVIQLHAKKNSNVVEGMDFKYFAFAYEKNMLAMDKIHYHNFLQ